MSKLVNEREAEHQTDGQGRRAAGATPAEGMMTDAVTRDAAIDLDGERSEAASLAPAADEPKLRPAGRPLYKRPWFLVVAGLALIAGIIFGVRYWLHARAHESTDDAFIDGTIVQVSPKVAGYVAKLHVTDNQQVKEGDLIAEINPRDFEVRLAQARAALDAGLAQQQQAQTSLSLTRATTRAGVQQASAVVEQARVGVATARAGAAAEQTRIAQARAGVTAAEANAAQARSQVEAAEAEARRANADVERYRALYERDEISRQQLEQAVASSATANAQVAAARQRVAAAEAQISEARAAQSTAAENVRRAQTQIGAAQAGVGEALGRLAQANTAPQQVATSQAQVETAGANLEQLRAQVRQAELDLSYTKIYAPAAGRVTRRAIEEGALVQAGQALMALVTSEVWVTANFKENQIGKMRPGQAVEIKVDAYPGQVFRGHIDSIQAGTGSAFSLIPPENATGNYVKVVQRVPVKIVFDDEAARNLLLAPGMSVEPEVSVP